MKNGVILLPGIVTPAELAYGSLRDALSDAGGVVLKNLAIYDTESPPADYGLDAEVAALLRTAAEHGFERFHLAGYSGGGAAAVAFAARHSDRLLSLGLLEPAWFGNSGMDDDERRFLAEAEDVAATLPPEQAMPAFVRLNLAPGVEPPPPPPGPPPPWMKNRPAGIQAITAAFRQNELDMDALRRFRRPVLYMLGALSNQALYGTRAERARQVFPDFTLEVFEERHHFDPPHRAEPERTAKMLEAFWARAEEAV